MCWARFVERAVSKHGEQDVGSASGQGDNGLVMALSFSSFLIVVGPGSRVAFNGSTLSFMRSRFNDQVLALAKAFALAGARDEADAIWNDVRLSQMFEPRY